LTAHHDSSKGHSSCDSNFQHISAFLRFFLSFFDLNPNIFNLYLSLIDHIHDFTIILFLLSTFNFLVIIASSTQKLSSEFIGKGTAKKYCLTSEIIQRNAPSMFYYYSDQRTCTNGEVTYYALLGNWTFLLTGYLK